jgi:hypothetical protein
MNIGSAGPAAADERHTEGASAVRAEWGWRIQRSIGSPGRSAGYWTTRLLIDHGDSLSRWSLHRPNRFPHWRGEEGNLLSQSQNGQAGINQMV